MNDTLQLIAAALSGGAVTGGFTLIGTYLTSKQKVQEIKLQYQHKLEEEYNERARQYIESLYKPLNKALTILFEHYSIFFYSNYEDYGKLRKEIDNGTLEELKQAFDTFFNEVSSLLKEGDSGYLTPELEDELNGFIDFIRRSMQTKNGKRKLNLSDYVVANSIRNKIKEVKGVFMLVNVHHQWLQVWAAPIGSIEFKYRFYYQLRYVQSLIRRVMLKSND